MKKMLIAILCLGLVMVSGNAFADTKAISGANAGSDASISTIDNSVNNVYDRKFVNGGVPHQAHTNGFFTAPTPDSSFRSIKDWFKATVGEGKYLTKLSEGALKELAKGGNSTVHLQISRGNDQVPRIYKKGDFFNGTDNPRWLWLALEEPVYKDVQVIKEIPILEDGNRVSGFEKRLVTESKVVGTKKMKDLRVTGIVDGEADNGDTNSMQVVARAGLKVIKDGSNVMVITAEGAHRKVFADGWFAGAYVSGGTVAESGMNSMTGGLGGGYSSNKTGPEDKPWFQGYVGCNKEFASLKAQIEANKAK